MSVKLSRRKPFKMKQWINNATTKISNEIKQKYMQIAEWFWMQKLINIRYLQRLKIWWNWFWKVNILMLKWVITIKRKNWVWKRITAFKNNAIVVIFTGRLSHSYISLKSSFYRFLNNFITGWEIIYNIMRMYSIPFRDWNPKLGQANAS